MIEFFVPGQPVGKGRPRIGRFGPHARMFTPEKTVNYESTVKLFASQAMGGRALVEAAVSVQLLIGVMVPASWSGVKQRKALAGEIHPTTKPDIDNVEKAIYDAMNGVVWKDDVQVVEVSKRKCYVTNPGVKVNVTELA